MQDVWSRLLATAALNTNLEKKILFCLVLLYLVQLRQPISNIKIFVLSSSDWFIVLFVSIVIDQGYILLWLIIIQEW